MSWWLLASLGALAFFGLLIGRRVWPVLHGSVRDGDSRAQRMNRWNTYMAPMIREYLKEQCLVGLAGTFRSQADTRDLLVGVWSLRPTLLPDVDYVALSQLKSDADDDALPDERADGARVFGFVEAEALRDFLGNAVIEQYQYGHLIYLYSWPEGVDPAGMSSIIIPADEFRTHHGVTTQVIGEES